MCVVCSPAQLETMCSTGQRRGCLVHHLRRIRQLDAAAADAALRRVPVEWRATIARALTGADARAAGLMWSAADIRPIAQGASGPVAGMAITLDRVTLGGHEARNVRAIIVPEGLGVSLLGQSFLASVQPVRIEQDRMVLGE